MSEFFSSWKILTRLRSKFFLLYILTQLRSEFFLLYKILTQLRSEFFLLYKILTRLRSEFFLLDKILTRLRSEFFLLYKILTQNFFLLDSGQNFFFFIYPKILLELDSSVRIFFFLKNSDPTQVRIFSSL